MIDLEKIWSKVVVKVIFWLGCWDFCVLQQIAPISHARLPRNRIDECVYHGKFVTGHDCWWNQLRGRKPIALAMQGLGCPSKMTKYLILHWHLQVPNSSKWVHISLIWTYRSKQYSAKFTKMKWRKEKYGHTNASWSFIISLERPPFY